MITALYLGARWIAGRRLSRWAWVGMLLGLACVILSGSRGCLLALGLGLIGSQFLRGKLPPRLVPVLVLVGAAVVLLGVATISGSGLSMFSRSGNGGLLTERGNAWSSILTHDVSLATMFLGSGVNNQQVAVPFNGFSYTQVINNGWLVAYVQAGIVGVGLLGAYLLSIFRSVRWRMVADVEQGVAVILGVVTISFTEAGLLSVAPLGIGLLAFAYLACDARSVGGRRDLARSIYLQESAVDTLPKRLPRSGL